MGVRGMSVWGNRNIVTLKEKKHRYSERSEWNIGFDGFNGFEICVVHYGFVSSIHKNPFNP